MPKFTKQLKQTIHKIYTTLKKAGFDDISIAGMLGNALSESSFNPDSISPSDYRGLWLNSKNIHDALVSTYGNHNIDSQLLYVIDWTNASKNITKGKHRDWLATGAGKFKKSGYKNATDAADAFMKLYERPVITDSAGVVIGYQKDKERKANAALMYDYLNNAYNNVDKVQEVDVNYEDIMRPLWKRPAEIPVNIPKVPSPTQYPLNPKDRLSVSIDSWNSADSPAYGGKSVYLPDVQKANNKRKEKMEDALDKSLLNIDYSPTYTKFEIPKANCGKDRKPRFDEGTPYAVGPYNVYPSAVAELQKGEDALLNATWNGPDIPIVGTDRRPVYQRYDAENSVYDGNAIRNITDWAPGIGDVSQGFDAVNAFKNNKYEEAALLGGLLLLPNALEPIVKPLTRGASKIKNSLITFFKNSTPAPQYGNGAYSALKRRWTDEELKQLSKNNPIRELYGQNYDEYPELIKKSIYNSVYKRINALRKDPNFEKLFSDAVTEKYTTYSGEPFKRSFGEDRYGGVYFDDTDHIAIRDGLVKNSLGHETIHLIDNKLGRTLTEKSFLEDAFDGIFLKNATEYERSTTNYDSRKKFLGELIDANSHPTTQNKIIDAATKDEVFDAVENSNLYGRKYILEKRKAGLLNQSLANKIKDSWKYVGMYGGAGTALGWQASKLDEEDYNNTMSRLKTLIDGIGLYNGGKDIDIKPSKRGTFTAAAKKRGKSVQAFASQVLSNPGKYSKAIRKKALFAKNASKWSH